MSKDSSIFFAIYDEFLKKSMLKVLQKLQKIIQYGKMIEKKMKKSLLELHFLTHRPGHSYGKNIKLHKMKNEKNYMGFLIHKI